jgi:hypothetical protein
MSHKFKADMFDVTLVIDTTFGNNTGAPTYCLAGTVECDGAVCSGGITYRCPRWHSLYTNLPEALRPENLRKYDRSRYGE